MKNLYLQLEKRCSDSNLYNYIYNSLEYLKSNNENLYYSICDQLELVLNNYPNFRIIKSNGNLSYISLSQSEICICEKETISYLTFIHEITHLIHGFLYDFEIPIKYESERKKLETSQQFFDNCCSIMRRIIEKKKSMLVRLKDYLESKDNSKFRKYIININIDNKKINNILNIQNNKNDLINIIDNSNYKNDLSYVIETNKKLNRIILENLVDDFPESFQQQIQVYKSVEGIIDAILLGKLYGGIEKNCIYLKGYGHSEEYFNSNINRSFIELIADFTAVLTQNDEELIKQISMLLGDDMITILNQFVYKIFNYDVNNILRNDNIVKH